MVKNTINNQAAIKLLDFNEDEKKAMQDFVLKFYNEATEK